MRHPKPFSILLAALLLALCACSQTQPPASGPEPDSAAVAPTLTPVPSAGPESAPPSDAPEPESESEPEAEPEPESEPAGADEEDGADELKAIALGLVGADVSALYDAVGYPISSSYAPSCLGDGEDGELVYDGFTVYTFKAASGGETVSVVL